MFALAGGRLKGVKPRAQWIPSIGGSCCVFRADRSCGLDAVESAVWAKENAASNRTTDRSKIFDFMMRLLLGEILRRDERSDRTERGNYMSKMGGIISTSLAIYENRNELRVESAGLSGLPRRTPSSTRSTWAVIHRLAVWRPRRNSF